jgi:hypothetical protein
MKRLMSCIAVIVVSSGLLFAQQAKSKVVMGYLSDVMCATSPNGISADGFNLSLNPEKHTAACMKMASCEASGYGIFLKGSDGKYTFTKFDAKGNDLVKAYLKKTKRKDGLIVDATGIMDGKIFRVEKIIEASADMKMPGMKM